MLEDVQQGAFGFGVRIEGPILNTNIGFRDNSCVQIDSKIRGMSVEQLLRVDRSGNAIQRLTISSRSRSGPSTLIKYKFGLDVSVHRASYGQLTERGPLPIPPSKNVLELQEEGEQFSVTNSNLDATLEGILVIDGLPVNLTPQLRNSVSHERPVSAEYGGEIRVWPGTSVTMTATFRLHAGVVLSKFQSSMRAGSTPSRGHWRIGNDEAGMIIKRNLEYILGNCTVPVGNGAVCFLTDHVALPLGWNRDN
jgi:hypothetical protein